MNKSCKVYNSSYLYVKDDDIACDIQKFAADLYLSDFAYICMIPLALIIIISIFGRLKGNYQWFILNQAIFDLFFTSDYNCNKKLPFIAFSPCFYLAQTYFTTMTFWHKIWDGFIISLMNGNPFSSLLLFSSVRFLALYFPRIYDKFTKGINVFYTIFIYHLIFTFTDLYWLFPILLGEASDEFINDCILTQNLSRASCSVNFRKTANYFILDTIRLSFFNIQRFKLVLFMMLSVLASILIVYKVAKQAKFQLKHNRKDFINSVRITAVICLQLILNIFVFLIEGIRLFYALASALGIKYFDNTIYSSGLNLAGYLDFRIPLWLDYSYGLSSVFPRLMIIQIRIFIESLIVLFIMTGYREVIENVVKYIYRIIRHPRKNFKGIKTFISGSNSTTPISVY